MKTFTSQGKHGIEWTACIQLDDFDLPDNLNILSHTHQQMHMKTTRVAAASASVSLNIHNGKTNILKYNTENTNTISLGGETLEEVETFTYLDSIIDEQGGSDADVKERTSKATTTFSQLKNIWNSKQLSTNINARIFNMNIKTVLLNRADTSGTTTTTIIKKYTYL
ncbi:unnamed protein product [Schistosoma curassoni]|uniref:DUF6451 domain-containing protein n=1 Tax=Schistosoma curassoni TaxID=6186 RepID=A0A183L076_9TREM|nr:unnamed protein product [Schistosoma curassoni]